MKYKQYNSDYDYMFWLAVIMIVILLVCRI